jgi:hypothetical protein
MAFEPSVNGHWARKATTRTGPAANVGPTQFCNFRHPFSRNISSPVPDFSTPASALSRHNSVASREIRAELLRVLLPYEFCYRPNVTSTNAITRLPASEISRVAVTACPVSVEVSSSA